MAEPIIDCAISSPGRTPIYPTHITSHNERLGRISIGRYEPTISVIISEDNKLDKIILSLLSLL